jgi:hypothetical protein
MRKSPSIQRLNWSRLRSTSTRERGSGATTAALFDAILLLIAIGKTLPYFQPFREARARHFHAPELDAHALATVVRKKGRRGTKELTAVERVVGLTLIYTTSSQRIQSFARAVDYSQYFYLPLILFYEIDYSVRAFDYLAHLVQFILGHSPAGEREGGNLYGAFSQAVNNAAGVFR